MSGPFNRPPRTAASLTLLLALVAAGPVRGEVTFEPEDQVIFDDEVLIVGDTAAGSLAITDQGEQTTLFTPLAGILGNTATGEGEVIVTGSGATWTVGGLNTGDGLVSVGDAAGATGSLNILRGGLVDIRPGQEDGPGTGLLVARRPAALGEVVVDGTGSRLLITGPDALLDLGPAGGGAMTVSAAARVAVEGSGARLWVAGGEAGGSDITRSALEVLSGGQVTVTGDQARMQIGGLDTSGVVRINGADSRLAVTGDGALIEVGGGGLGALIVEDDALVETDRLTVGTSDRGSAQLTLSGGRVRAGNIEFGLRGRLTGTGTLTGRVVNRGGIISPGDPLGTLDIDGDLAFNSGFLALDIQGTGAGEHDLIRVTGEAAITGGGLIVQPLGGYRPEEGDQVVFLTAGEGITAYRPGQLDFTALDPTLDYSLTPQDGNLTFTVLPAPTPEVEEALEGAAGNDSQRSVAQVLADACRTATGALGADCRALDQAGNDPNLDQALGAISPEEVVAPADTAQGGAIGQTRRIGSRLKALRSGATPVSLDRITFHHRDGRVLTATDLNRLMAAGGGAGDEDHQAGAVDETIDATFEPWGVFVDGDIALGDKDATGNEAGYEFDVWALTLGADYRVNREVIVGAALDYARTDTELDRDGGEVDSDSLALNLYASYYPGQRWFVDGLVGYGRLGFDQQRRVRYQLATGTRVDQMADADYDGDQWTISVGSGYNLERGALSFGPEGRLQYTHTELDRFREQMSDPDAPGGGLAVVMEEQEIESLTLNLGGQVSYAFSQSWGVLVPQARLEWVHEFMDDSRGVKGRFADDPQGEVFTISTDDPDRNYFNLGLGVSAVLPGGFNAFAYYEATLGYEDLDQHNFGLGARWEF